MTAARTYNQTHVARKQNGRRRIGIYWTWSYPWEAQRDPGEMYNRFSTMTEVRKNAGTVPPFDAGLPGTRG
jgi:hypothetical protein